MSLSVPGAIPSLRAGALCLLLLAGMATASAVPDYLERRDETTSWKVIGTQAGEGFTVHQVSLVSQTWQGEPWQHWLSIVVPDTLDPARARTGLVFIDGGSQESEPPERISRQVAHLGGHAVRTGTIIALLRQVPNQPLFGLKEDALIAHTFVSFLASGDPSWPALLPMTRSAMSAMDAIQAFARDQLGTRVERFFITGASKRGWTTWLTGAFDPRVAAIAPMVIDTLNFPEQMKLQLASFGKYSMEIRDYTERDLPDRVAEPRAQSLIGLVDPFAHRDRLTMPKLIVCGTNDPYWPIEAASLYFRDLPGANAIHYMPNTGHAPGPSALAAIAAFYQATVDGTPFPHLEWRTDEDGRRARIAVTSTHAPLGAELWTATAPARDFREATFTATAITVDGTQAQAEVTIPGAGFTAAFVALRFSSTAGSEFTLCTTVSVFGASLYF